MKQQAIVQTRIQTTTPPARGILQRAAVRSTPDHAVPPIMHEVLRSPGQPPDPATRAVIEPRFGHDLSRVPVRTAAPTMIQPRLTISQPRDKYEREADRVADLVMGMPERGIQLQPT